MATTCLTNNFRKGLLKADYDFDSAVQDYYMALYNAGATRNQNTGAYTTTDETSGTGYTAAGKDIGDFTQATDTTNHVSHLDATDVSWATSALTATDCLIYRNGGTSPVANASVYVGDFGGPKSSSGGGTFTVVFPAAGFSTSIIRLA